MRRVVLMTLAVVATLALSACGDEEQPVTSAPTTTAGGGDTGRGMVEGVVRDGAGAPVAGVMVVPVPKDEPAPAVPELAVFTDADGRYQWTLPPGSFEMTANREGATRGTTTVQVAGDGTVRADIEVRTGS